MTDKYFTIVALLLVVGALGIFVLDHANFNRNRIQVIKYEPTFRTGSFQEERLVFYDTKTNDFYACAFIVAQLSGETAPKVRRQCKKLFGSTWQEVSSGNRPDKNDSSEVWPSP